MKLSCKKCNKILTTDLRPIKKSKLDSAFFKSKSEKDFGYDNYRLKQGIFILEKNKTTFNNEDTSGIKGLYQVFNEKGGILVSELSIIDGIIPEIKKGHGCCNWSLGRTLICDCKQFLGEMYLDCYEEGYVKFFHKSVIRSYKTL